MKDCSHCFIFDEFIRLRLAVIVAHNNCTTDVTSSINFNGMFVFQRFKNVFEHSQEVSGGTSVV